MSRIVSESYAILIGVIADDKGTPTVLAKSVPAATPTVETISDGEVSIEEAPAPSASRAPARRNTKGKAKATTQSPELIRHIEMENKLERTALDLLQQVREMREWRFATYGDE